MFGVFLKIVGGIAIVLISFYISLQLLEYFDKQPAADVANLCESSGRIVLRRPFEIKFGFAVEADISSFQNIADLNEGPSRSPLILCEENRQLGPAHSLHDDIRKIGLGRYSHWGTVILFSSSDNSDPRVNNRIYSIVEP